MRLFIAVLFSDEIKKALIGTMHDLKVKGVAGAYVSAQNLHMTLCFIGETTKVNEIKEAMDRISFAPFRLGMTDIGTFGDLLWVGAKGNQGLKGAARDLRMQLDASGIPYDKKEFKPHITIVRKMRGTLPKGYQIQKADMMVKKISLMKSENKNGKMVYTEIYSI